MTLLAALDRARRDILALMNLTPIRLRLNGPDCRQLEKEAGVTAIVRLLGIPVVEDPDALLPTFDLPPGGPRDTYVIPRPDRGWDHDL